jgi:hypothetical protein
MEKEQELRLGFGFEHVLDQLVGQVFGADVIGSVGDSLRELVDLCPAFLIGDMFVDVTERIAWGRIVEMVHTGLKRSIIGIQKGTFGN